jgi:GT2 family glycosyltransferase
LPEYRVTVIVPTVGAGAALEECVRSLLAQTVTDVEIIVVDNSGKQLAAESPSVRESTRVIHNDQNVGFGAAINQGIRASQSPFIAVLNDDAVAHPDWLERMLASAEARYEIGMCAPQIRLIGPHQESRLDSAGMLIARDGSSKQRGHGEPVATYARPQQALLPTGCAALYRRDMLDEIGLFDERFFLYCEDTDLGLRARWKLWECMYAPSAIVDHRYSHSAGKASSLKAFYVERNRLFVAVKNFPLPDLALVPLFTLVRFFWHLVYLSKGQGKASEYRAAGNSNLAGVALRAWAALMPELPRLLRERRKIQHHGRMNPKQFSKLLAAFRVGERQVARL